MADHAGNRWYKCDLHLHTMTSTCYLDKEDTPKDWVKRALEQGLSVVAVTDHNDYRGIMPIMEEAKEQGLAVFPGVEITCDSSKIHMLILFDTHKHADTVRDFLNRCDIDSDLVGSSEGTSLGVFEICEIAKKRGALVIAAHIDEFNSISDMNPANLDKLFSGGYIDAVQVSNYPIWNQYEKDKDAEAMYRVLGEKYGADATPQEIERWRKCFNRAKTAGLPMLAFSDNPRSEHESKHGLAGIGTVYTWIQMDDVVNLESIRQSLLAPETRIRMMFDSEAEPRTESDFWIQKMEIRHTQLNPFSPIRLNFNPQLNCIIGGKGSGKSAIVRLLLGIYPQFSGTSLPYTLSEENKFYVPISDDNSGIFQEDSEIEICFSWYGTQYRMLVNDIKSTKDQKYTFFRYDPETGQEVEEYWEELLSSNGFGAQVLTHRQVNEIATVPEALLDYTDCLIDDMHLMKSKKELYFEDLINLSSQLSAAENALANESRVKTELAWYEQSLKQARSDTSFLSERIAERKKVLKLMNSLRKTILHLQEKRQDLLEKYEGTLEEIRALRKNFIETTLANDENYAMELQPHSSRASLYHMLKETLYGDSALISEDVKKLEDALFSGKNGVEEFTKLLLLARKGPSAEETFSPYFIHLIRRLRGTDFERLLLFRPEDELNMFYHPNGTKRFFPLTNASAGEKATAVFSFILASSTAPLVIDQPEDDMDNRVIFEEVVNKLKNAKQRRQLIIVTHNANIAINTDPEMIISMDSHSKFVRVRLQGSADNDDVRREVCDIVEGTERAFLQRAKKYHFSD